MASLVSVGRDVDELDSLSRELDRQQEALPGGVELALDGSASFGTPKRGMEAQ